MRPTRPVLGFSATSGTGKTTLMVKVIGQLSQAGVRVAAIKHGHHPADPDVPGKDTHRFRRAGAETVMFASRERWFLIQELHGREEPTLAEQMSHVQDHDLILVEGYKNEDHPKIVLHRMASGKASLHDQLRNVIAVVTDDPGLVTDLPRFSLEDAVGVAAFIRQRFGLGCSTTGRVRGMAGRAPLV